MKKLKRLLVLILAITLIAGVGYKITDDGDDFELLKNLEIYHNVLKQLRINYVDEIDTRQIITQSIDKMLENLDPYTVYYPEAEIESIRLLSEAQYVGVGISIDTFKNNIYITDIENKSSANKQGLQIGDIITAVNDIKTNDKSLSDFDRLLSGQANTTVNLTIKRGETEKIYSLKRENIELPVVSLVEKIDNFGYIKLETFSDKSASEFKAALITLKKQKIEGLIIDLRDNPGGLLDQAVKIVNLFIDKDMLVVTSKGKCENSNGSFFTTEKPIDKDIPIIVLVNSHSASASEIVAGALQDYDRAIIIGEQTYGKGLVQRIFDVGYNSKIKITISKYYIPSGRCIQAIDYSGNDAKNVNISDTKFYTTNGRIVYEGIGIVPDILIESDTLPEIIQTLNKKHFIFLFTNNYYQTLDTSKIEVAQKISFQDKENFINYLKVNNFFETTDEIRNIKEIEKSMKGNNVVEAQLLETKSLIIKEIEKQITNNFKYINILVSKQIVKRKYLHKGEIMFSLTHDQEIKKAKFYLSNFKEYESILKKK
ncbi:MAG: S41 family peptidase [Bacteroidales bacterium]|nr:S41 family peptidase [Bacteroidales bacterium]